MNSISLHRVTKVETKSRNFDSHGGFKVRNLYITNEDGVTFEITLFSNKEDALKIKKYKE